jgi:hypothetical protein
MLKKGDKAHFFIRVAGDASEGPNTVAIGGPVLGR